MLANFFGSLQLRRACTVSFSYRASPAYTSGLYKRVKVDFPVFSLRLPDPYWVDNSASHWPNGLKLAARVLFLTLRLPMLLYGVLVLARLFRRIRPQILHINNGGYPAALSCLAAALAARLCGIRRVIMVVNNLAVPYTDPKRWPDYPVDRLVGRCVKTFVTGSAVAGERLREVLRLPTGKVLPLHNGIALRRLTETPEATRLRLGLSGFGGVLFGIVAILEERNGHRVLLEAMRHLVTSDPAFASRTKLLIEGDGPLRKELEHFVVEHALAERVKFVGNEENVFNFMQALDVFVQHSIDYSDFPNVNLEAMALGKPVIASRIAGTPEQIVDGVTGLLVPPGDSAALANAIAVLARDSLLREQLGSGGLRRFQENFTAEIAVERYLRLYHEMAGG